MRLGRPSTRADWQPAALVALLLVLAVVSDAIAFEIRGLRLSGAFLGARAGDGAARPSARRGVGRAPRCVDACVPATAGPAAGQRRDVRRSFPLVGGLARRRRSAADGTRDAARLRAGRASSCSWSRTPQLRLHRRRDRVRLRRRRRARLRIVYVTVLPSEFATGLLTAGVASPTATGSAPSAARRRSCSSSSSTSSARAAARVRARRRARAAHARARGAAGRPARHGLQTLSHARRHDRAPLRGGGALRARGRARCSGLDEREQDLIHTAGLLHDIGKFIFPD